MAQLPTVGGDDGTWGTILNAFLSISHNSDGTMKVPAATIFVAASDAIADVRAVTPAAYLCDGTADNVQIQAAIDALPITGGKIVLSEGTFYISATIWNDTDNVTIEGANNGQDVAGSETGGTILKWVTGTFGSQEPMLACGPASSASVTPSGALSTPAVIAEGAQLSAVDTTITVNTAAGIAVGDVLWLDYAEAGGGGQVKEAVWVTGVSGANLTVVRGYARTTAGVHSDGVAVTGTRGVYGTHLRDFLIDGVAGGTDMTGVRLCGNRSLFFNLGVQNMTGDHIEIHRGSSYWTQYDNRILSCQIIGNSPATAGSGIHGYTGVGDTIITNNVIAHCKIGLEINGSGGFIEGNHVYNNEKNVVDSGGTNTKYVGNKFDNPDLDNVTFTGAGSYTVIVGNSFTDTDGALDAANTYSALVFTGATGNPFNVTIVGNTFYGQTGNEWKYAIDLQVTGCRGIVIMGNAGDNDWGTKPINNQGLSCLIKDNRWGETSGIADPGNAGAIPVDMSGSVPLVSAGAETRTLAAPQFIDQELTLYCKTFVGNIVVTCTTTINETGNNTITFTATGQAVKLFSVEEGSTRRWRCATADGAALSTV